MLLDLICKELGVEIGEEWLASNGHTYKITHDGRLFVRDHEWIDVDEWANIISGYLKPKWKPKIGETYYVPEVYGQELYNNWIWEDDECDRDVIKKDIVFKTKEEAIDCANKMLEVVKEG